MKILISLVLILALLSGCGGPEVPETEAPDPGTMTDEELVMAVSEGLWNTVFSGRDTLAGFESLTEHQKLVFALNYLDMEVANGGLCQYFANDGGLTAPYISSFLEILGAAEHQALFDGFTGAQGIDVRDLSEFSFVTIEDFVALYDLYPFEEFDDAYYTLPPLSGYLAEYIRKYPADFGL